MKKEHSTMKTGVMIRKTDSGYINIGDYIQSIAARQFFTNNSPIYLDRERLNSYTGEKVKLIMNGWFLFKPENWPPSECIDPLFVSFHINEIAKEKLLSDESIEYFKQHEPIGCRDMNTKNMLIDRGVSAYFSGCLTLSLGESYSSSIKNNKIYFVDPFLPNEKKIIPILKAIFFLFKRFNLIKILCDKLFKSITFKKLIRASMFYFVYSQRFEDEVLLNSEYIVHIIKEPGSENEKFEYAEQLIKLYSNAFLVVTSRIHCALPCLAMNTPVIYIDNVNQSKVSSCRLDGILDLFNVISYKDSKLLPQFSIGTDKLNIKSVVTNKNNYRPIKQNLLDVCYKFASKS